MSPSPQSLRMRSLLFAPGDSERKSLKALQTDADCVILDLEDSVAPAGKVQARALAASIIRQSSRPGVVLRINPIGTEWYADDVVAAVSARPMAVMLPKCVGPEQLLQLDRDLARLEIAAGLNEGTIRALLLVTETAGSLVDLAYVGVAPRLAAMCFGAEDLSADLGISPRDETGAYPAPVTHARAAMLIAAAAAGVPALDTPFPDFKDEGGLRRESAAARRDGFAGKLCIHPGQVSPVNDVFTPDPERVRWARAVRDAFAANPGAGVLNLDGKMLDQPHLKLARRILVAAGEG